MLARLMERVSMQRRTAYGQVMSKFCQDAFEGHVHLSGSERIGRLSFSSVARGSVWQRSCRIRPRRTAPAWAWAWALSKKSNRRSIRLLNAAQAHSRGPSDLGSCSKHCRPRHSPHRSVPHLGGSKESFEHPRGALRPCLVRLDQHHPAAVAPCFSGCALL